MEAITNGKVLWIVYNMASYDLIIMRHAKSDWNHEHISDFDRPLNSRGKQDAPRMAQWMKDVALRPEVLICSPAVRASQTAAEIIKHLDIPESSVIYDKRMYLASTATLCKIVKETDDRIKSTMLIGHNPGLEDLAIELCKERIPVVPGKGLISTANILHLRMLQPWCELKSHSCDFVQIMRPKQLP